MKTKKLFSKWTVLKKFRNYSIWKNGGISKRYDIFFASVLALFIISHK
ncbi:hypothetical protein MUN88_20900 [Gracilibacillus caseinilyticus]|uniref:Uncharacterized protein n=1 Tax=Gracilibacillus caseinilyticus TaxID=2932256 RepID=A0ABY4EVP5_9BACI|nr:hypothetical protein [Gracilibacillus caseinilyticus]UOQ48459.1 hypothetical protein MUN88_20900 [Gracilibacillus caseinilyticus]